MPILTIYPDPGTGATTVDGFVERGAVNEAMAVIRAGAGTNSHDMNVIGDFVLMVTNAVGPNTYDDLIRSIFTFDTSPLTLRDIVTAATLTFNTAGRVPNDNFGTSICLVDATPANDNAIVNADYSTVGTTRYAADVALAGIGIGPTYFFTLNIAGSASINRGVGAITRFSQAFDWDVDNTDPPGWAGATIDDAGGVYADTPGTASDPALAITYSSASRKLFVMNKYQGRPGGLFRDNS